MNKSPISHFLQVFKSPVFEMNSLFFRLLFYNESPQRQKDLLPNQEQYPAWSRTLDRLAETAPTDRFKPQSANKTPAEPSLGVEVTGVPRQDALPQCHTFHSGVKTHSGSNCCKCLTFRSKLSKGNVKVNRMEDEASDESRREAEGGKMNEEELQTGGSVK